MHHVQHTIGIPDLLDTRLKPVIRPKVEYFVAPGRTGDYLLSDGNIIAAWNSKGKSIAFIIRV